MFSKAICKNCISENIPLYSSQTNEESNNYLPHPGIENPSSMDKHKINFRIIIGGGRDTSSWGCSMLSCWCMKHTSACIACSF